MTKATFTNVSNEGDFQWKKTSNGRLRQISKVKYLSNYWLDLRLPGRKLKTLENEREEIIPIILKHSIAQSLLRSVNNTGYYVLPACNLQCIFCSVTVSAWLSLAHSSLLIFSYRSKCNSLFVC